MRLLSVRGGADSPQSADDAVMVPWWSFGKTILAVAALRLVEMGRLALDAPLASKPYTLRQLLQHRAGLGNYGRLADYHAAVAAGEAPWSEDELIHRTAADRLRYPPGTDWLYSNLGYLQLRRLVEAAANRPLGDALQALVLGPAGARTSRLASTPADLAGVRMGGAPDYHPGWVYHGLLVGPLGEATLVLHRLLSGALLSPAMLEAMQGGHPLTQYRTAALTSPGYGLGLMTNATASGLAVFGHGGSGPGSNVAVFGTTTPHGPVVADLWSADETLETLETAAIGLLETGQ